MPQVVIEKDLNNTSPGMRGHELKAITKVSNQTEKKKKG